MSFPKEQISGTLVNYYATCKREAWLYSRKIHARQDDENVLIGKSLSELKENLDDFPYSNLRFDKVSRQKGHYEITEYKKTLKNKNAAKMQLLFYIYTLKNALGLKKVYGKVVSSKTVITVDDSDENFDFMKRILSDMSEFLSLDLPPKAIKTKFCKNCAYNDYCF
ncbi:CRISPR-associated protein Cas4 [Campylobacter ureolyticus]|uniref:CRISPR-associated protein Cas4 n=1 Tax=Campylobacter ureolyticus TaxID=827 RepID=A0A381EB37_9BACT|nr:CRISPR-associated protein Cas4 [Campylobacter ureolyticus]MCR8684680.1 CRISPR-associated protein Cas4 [Campylobacter ureolyticus]MCZ6103758.1 CRISPR-associated protein Cas4 [Campylobacter ureolyticus]MCZ6134792.1 CRISPR-associated protein Cas4 [Campylobacter ureolyticus]MCZ6162076.1 CRISPR-associated protein Cas4 [Campylobacter ureolyticus]MCZ6170849.1 CRISPR-associated protein Cas4 [Campylobacter ureolyticus]